MGTTLGKKEEVKSSVRSKKAVAVKRVTKKDTGGPSPAAIKKVVRKRVLTKPKKPAEPQKPAEVVFVPGAASLRLLEKVQLYTIWYERHVPTVMSGAAKIGGYAFIFLGATFAVFSYVDTNSILSSPAALVCSESDCKEVSDESLPPSAPKITFLNSIPDIIEADLDFKISATNSGLPTVRLIAIESGDVLVLESVEKLNETEYRFMLPGSRLTAASYKMEAVTDQNGISYTYQGPTFTIIPTLPAVKVEEVLVAEIEENNNESTTTVPAVDEELNEDEARGEEETEAAPVSTETMPLVEEVQDETSTTSLAVSNSNDRSPIKIALYEQAGSAYVKIQTGNFTPSKVDVYSQIEAGGQPLYLGQATLVQGEWIFSVSALTLPLTNHYLYASFVEAGQTYTSEAVLYTPAYETGNSATTEADLAILVQKIELALLASAINNQNRGSYYGYFTSQSEALFARNDEEKFADKELLDVIDSSMQEDSSLLEPLLLHFAAAVQSENSYLIALSSDALNSHYTKLASKIASVIGEPTAVPAIHTILSLRYQILKDKIRESEDQIKQDTNNLTAKDSDQDGISDFDEVANFNTNPLYADTDADGVVDGIELLRDFDPLIADLVSVPSTHNSFEDITIDDAVEITFIGPEVSAGESNESEEYYLRVEGMSIPNSYVYLIAESVDVVAVVKTGSSGIFAYTIERDFAKGEHQITAVMSDNSGDIVASSRPHQFTRTNDNAFVAAAALANNPAPQSAETKDTIVLHLLVAAVGVITFGFILLLFSNTLRNRKVDKVKPA